MRLYSASVSVTVTLVSSTLVRALCREALSCSTWASSFSVLIRAMTRPALTLSLYLTRTSSRVRSFSWLGTRDRYRPRRNSGRNNMEFLARNTYSIACSSFPFSSGIHPLMGR